MLLSVSRRTDIPALYLDWFLGRLRAGFLCVRNPMNPRQISRISLAPEGIDGIVFWTKNPTPLLERLAELREYSCVYQVTLTGYGRDVEPGLPDKRKALLPALRRLAEAVGPERVIWRYDPILFNDRYTEDCHLRAFERIAGELRGATGKCVVSFVDAYRWNAARLRELRCRTLNEPELLNFAARLREIAAANGMEVAACAEALDLGAAGIARSACVDKRLFERLSGRRLKVGKDPGQRSECLCAQSVDVGAYNTCTHGCAYCYAARGGVEALRRNRARYDAASPLLCDAPGPEDRISERTMRSLYDPQGSLLDDL